MLLREIDKCYRERANQVSTNLGLAYNQAYQKAIPVI